MAAQWNIGLVEPISADAPCGKNLEDSGELSSLEAYQIFGLPVGQDSLEAPPKDADAPKREPRKSDRPPAWGDLEELSLDCLRKSKDLRALAHLGAAMLRTRGILEFVQVLGIASQWLELYWATVYPLVDEDALIRTNALGCFADRLAVVDGLRRAPLVSGPMGRLSMRDLDAARSGTAAEGQSVPDPAGISAAFASRPIEELRALHAAALEGTRLLRAIDQQVRTQAGVEASPAFDPLVAQFDGMASALKTRLAEHPEAVAADQGGTEDGAPAGSGVIGAVRSRQDAIRALDAVADFFRRSEPSSPVPLIVDRAKRLASKDFLGVLEDLAPGALSEAKSASGIRE